MIDKIIIVVLLGILIFVVYKFMYLPSTIDRDKKEHLKDTDSICTDDMSKLSITDKDIALIERIEKENRPPNEKDIKNDEVDLSDLNSNDIE